MKFFIAFFLIFLFLAQDAYAVTTSISNVPSSISYDSFTITVTVTGAGTGTNYLKAELYKEGTTNYFGETFNGSNWYKDSDGKQYLPISIQSGTPATIQLTARIGSPSSSEFDGGGQYKLRVKRHTSSGAAAASSEISASAISINIVIPTSTPQPTEEPTSTPIKSGSTPTITSTPTPIESGPTPSPVRTPTPSPTPTPAPTLTSSATTYSNIFISEVMAYPDSNENEWVEIYNSNSFSVKLTNWYIDDIEGRGSTAKIFSAEIGPYGYGVYDLSSAIFNNDGDSVRLLDYEKNLKDSFEYSNPTKGKSIGRISFDSDSFCIQDPSKGKSNGSCISSAAKTTTTPTKSPTPASTSPTPKKTESQSSKKNTQKSGVLGLGDAPTSSITEESQETEEGEVLGVSEINDSISRDLLIVKGTSASSGAISFLTILYSIRKILKKIKYE